VLSWLHRFQDVYNALMADSLSNAADDFGRLPELEDAAWKPTRENVLAARAVTLLDRQDLRG
jgi:hypothetical protein